MITTFHCSGTDRILPIKETHAYFSISCSGICIWMESLFFLLYAFVVHFLNLFIPFGSSANIFNMIRFWHKLFYGFFFLSSFYSLSIGHLILISFKAHISLFFIFDEEYKYKSYVTVSPWVSFAIFCFSSILVFLNGIQIKNFEHI